MFENPMFYKAHWETKCIRDAALEEIDIGMVPST